MPGARADPCVCAVVAAVAAGVIVVRREGKGGAGVLMVLRMAKQRVGNRVAGAS